MLLEGLNLGHNKYEVSSLAVSLSLEGKASHRELTSRLLSDLVDKVLTEAEMARAFDKMLKDLPDLILDTPEAPQVTEARSSAARLLCLHLMRLVRQNDLMKSLLAGGCRRIYSVKPSIHCGPCGKDLSPRSQRPTVSVILHWALFPCCGVCSQMLGQFIARAIADHALPMDFLSCYKGKVDCDHARWGVAS